MKDLNIELLTIISTIIILFVVLMMVLIYVEFLKKRTELLLRQKVEQANFEKELSQTQIEIREQTLSYVGQELHDDLGQKLSVAKLLSNKMMPSLEAEKRDSLQEINTLLGECISDVRNLTKTFMTEQVVHFGLIDSIEREIKRIEKLDFIKISFYCNNRDVDINSKHSLILFRMVQECINNSLKHSKAKKLDVSVDDGPKILEIRIVDNGIGIQREDNHDGSGLKNMKNRAQLIRAEFFLASELNEGTEIKIKYPKK